MQPRTIYLLAFCALVFAIAGYISFSGADAVTVSYAVSIAAAMLAVAIVRELTSRKGEPEKDERTVRIVRAASTQAWWLTYVLMAFLILAIQFGGFQISAISALSLVFFFTVFSQIAIRAYYSMKGDVE